MSGNEVAGYMTARKRYYYDRRPMELSGKHLENIPFGYFTSCLQTSKQAPFKRRRTTSKNTGRKRRSVPLFNLGNTDGMITCLTRAVLVACLLFRGVLAAEYLVGVGKDETTG